MSTSYYEEDILRYCRQIVLKAMNHVRATMRGSKRLYLKETIENLDVAKDGLNLTKAVDKEAEDLIIAALSKKFKKIKGINAFTVFSEELGIHTFPEDASEADSDLVIFIDPIDGTEFIESLQGGWCLMAVYDRRANDVIVAVAGDIFLDRLYWATKSGPPEALDFTTHSWFKLDGGPNPKIDLAGARINFLTTKVSRYRSIAKQTRLLDAIKENNGRINLSWGSNLIIQVAAGYADAAVEFTKGFATYDILPGFFIGKKAGLTILDMKGNPINTTLDIDEIFDTYRRDSTKPKRTKFVAAKEETLARKVLELIDIGDFS
jgi:myo-inositol-1(or 4)-monophosphatase